MMTYCYYDYMQKYEVFSGDDKLIVVALRDENNNAIDLTQVIDMIVTVSYREQEFAKYRYDILSAEIADYDGSVEYGELKNELKFLMESETTKKFYAGRYDVDVTLVYDITTYPDENRKSYPNKHYILVKNGINKEII